MGTAPQLAEMPSAAITNRPAVARPTFKVWTFGRTAPIVASGAIAVLAVATRPDLTGSLIAVAAEICLMGLLVKTWLLH